MTQKNMELWRSVEKTDPSATKGFVGKGGFGGTAVSPMYLIRRATELWGPIGSLWGIKIEEHGVLDGIDGEKLHFVIGNIFYPREDGVSIAVVPCFGQTTLCGRRKDGKPYLDEDAPKKSLTDALTKGLSWLGFAADVHMGRYDDVKYVNQIKAEFADEANRSAVRATALPVFEKAASDGLAALEKAWKTADPERRKACESDLELLKNTAKAKDAKNAPPAK